ncbi:hypothetical protein BIV59_17550 [Bacillus sp. MUM 13]|nr:hypothetical protein BIV59_17550 [Bacillus sp. MUM 13]
MIKNNQHKYSISNVQSPADFLEAQGLVSAYTVAQFKPHSKICNESKQKNEVNREFDQAEELGGRSK